MNATAPIRPAATIILTRDTAHGPEVFMMRRSPNSVFMSGVYVFPGGGLDDVIDPAETRSWIVSGLRALPPTPQRDGKKYPYIDTW